MRGSFQLKVVVRSEHTDGVLAAIEQTLSPKAFITPHTHLNDVWVYVLTGEVGVLVGETIDVAGVGHWALKPRMITHAMWNAGEQPARIIEVLTPGGSERWFEELALLPPDDNEGFEAACRSHGISFLRDSAWTAEIRERFGL